ncbi:unnamed protein product [Prorocentrum cordatum]|uniref:KIF-binding protein n=1 Tax=Prorocentrum cordatum TaxID=2364126 RepID=A0ABN9W866_9DINO|nr:unnamed protein product [Polarella glacialis]
MAGVFSPPARLGARERTEGDGPSALARYLDEEIGKAVAKYDELWAVEDPEENPYKSKYLARALLEAAVREVEQLLPAAADDAEAERGREMLARLSLFLGKNLYFCEEVPGAERHFTRALEGYLRSPLRQDPDRFCYIQDALNQIGMLWCNRHGFSEGFNYLRRAQIMFVNRPAVVREQREERANDHYTLTMFYLAQAYGHLQKPALSARFCAETMARQLEHNSPERRSKEALERDPFDCKDWVRNCCSLSDFFASECMFWTAEYLLHAACVMCQRCGEICGLEPDGLAELHAECRRDLGALYSQRLKFSKTCAEHPGLGEDAWRGEHAKRAAETAPSEGARLTFASGEPVLWDDVFPEVVHLEDEEAQIEASQTEGPGLEGPQVEDEEAQAEGPGAGKM